MMIRNEKGKVSKTKVGSALIGLAGTIEAAAAVPGIPMTAVPWMHVGAIFLGAMGALLGGVGIRDVLGNLTSK